MILKILCNDLKIVNVCRMIGRRKESVVSDVVRTLDELPSVVAKLTTSDTLYPFSQVLRLRVLQVTHKHLMLWSRKF